MKNRNVLRWGIYSLCCGLAFMVLSCGSAKSTAGHTAVKKMNAAKIIANHNKHKFDFKTLNAKVKVAYEDDEQSFRPLVTLRMEKDKTIWMSVRVLGITMAKMWITPEKISYYEKINSTYFEGDFEAVSQWLGVSLNFENMQRLLLGEALFDLKSRSYTETIANQTYQLQPKKQGALYELLFRLYPQNFKIALQELRQQETSKSLRITYPQYQKIASQDFPKEIQLVAKQKNKNTKITMTYREVTYNSRVTFPFKIPSGYKQVMIP